MKKTLLILIAMMATTGVLAQQKSQPAGMRMEVADEETDNGEYSIYTYKDEDGTFGYYLSIARTKKTLGADELFGMEVKNIKETTIYLGDTADKAFAAIDDILDLFDKDVDTTTEFKGRTTTSGDHLGETTTSTCVVTKKTLGGKRLKFTFTNGDREGEAYLTKSTLKDLRSEFKLHRKMHPKQHT